jgi:hypothetical protein
MFPPASEVAFVPAQDDELDPPVRTFPAAEEVALPKSVAAPVELADCAYAFCTSSVPYIPTNAVAKIPAMMRIPTVVLLIARHLGIMV